MYVSYDWYYYFYYVCTFKSITKTANYLFVTQPAVTKNIKNLEKAAGRILIKKNSKGIELTEDGNKLFNDIKESIENLDKCTKNLIEKNKKYKNTIYISAGVSTVKKFLMEPLTRFNNKYPNINFEISAFDGYSSALALESDQTDICFTSERFVKKDENVVFIPWLECHEMLVINSEDKEKYPSYIPVDKLCDYPLICKSHGSSIRRVVEKKFNDLNIPFNPTYQLSNHWLVEEYIKKKLGIGLVINTLIQDELNNNEFFEIKTNIDFPIRRFGVEYKKNSVKKDIIEEFIKEIIK